ncbi:MAG: polysaccharide pyruvyl transferase family protein [Candidatus Omnitrophica bacterium]|nr:polysaccharide pyruvyl transferase family protein [Candidatus Omnitrophota bacterium]
MNFLLIGQGSCKNRGCEAIVRTTINLLCENFKDCRVVLSSYDYANDKLVNFGNNVKVISTESNVWQRLSKDWFLRQIYRIFGKEDFIIFSEIIRNIEDIDFVLSIGGDNYSLDYGFPKDLLNLGNLLKNYYNKKLVIWAASIGPFSEDKQLKKIISHLSSVDLITVRESETLRYLDSIGIYKNVRVTADPAFLLPCDESVFDKSELIFDNSLGFNISPILSRYSSEKDNKFIISESISFLRKVINHYDIFVLLIPHVSYEGFNNDYLFMKEIYRELSNTSKIKIIDPIYNAMQTKAIISKCRFFIGARTHSTIASLSTKVPTLTIGYSIKSKGINRDLFDNYDLLINIEEFNSRILFQKLNILIDKEAEIRNILSLKIPQMQDLAKKNITYLKEIF